MPRQLLICLLALGSVLPAFAADTPSQVTARALQRKLGDAVVLVRATVSVTVTPGDQPAQTRDRTFEQLGTVVSSDGRVLLSATSQVKEAFIVLADGTEIAAKVVLKDKDLNLALLAPAEATTTPFVPVDVAVSDTVEPVDEVVVLGRMDKSLDRVSKVEIDAVAAVTTKPRPFISIHISATGCPVFSVGGKFVGLTSAKIDLGGDGDDEGVAMEPVVIPAAVVQKFLVQASTKPATK